MIVIVTEGELIITWFRLAGLSQARRELDNSGRRGDWTLSISVSNSKPRILDMMYSRPGVLLRTELGSVQPTLTGVYLVLQGLMQP